MQSPRLGTADRRRRVTQPHRLGQEARGDDGARRSSGSRRLAFGGGGFREPRKKLTNKVCRGFFALSPISCSREGRHDTRNPKIKRNLVFAYLARDYQAVCRALDAANRTRFCSLLPALHSPQPRARRYRRRRLDSPSHVAPGKAPIVVRVQASRVRRTFSRSLSWPIRPRGSDRTEQDRILELACCPWCSTGGTRAKAELTPTLSLSVARLLSAEHHPEWLRWISNDTFGITSVEAQAKAALSPMWEFRRCAPVPSAGVRSDQTRTKKSFATVELLLFFFLLCSCFLAPRP